MKFIANRLIILAMAFGVISCIEEFGDTGEPMDRHAQVVGTWKVNSMIQTDLLTDNPDNAVVDITDVYAFEEYTLTLNEDGSFTTSNTGNAPEFVIQNGSWAFNDEEFPSSLILTSGSNTSVLDFGSLNSLTDRNELEVTFTRKVVIPDDEGVDHEEDAIAYEYTLSKTN